jgi:hypothetical protein
MVGPNFHPKMTHPETSKKGLPPQQLHAHPQNTRQKKRQNNFLITHFKQESFTFAG